MEFKIHKRGTAQQEQYDPDALKKARSFTKKIYDEFGF